jgi:shikimate dehydrogenase
MSKRLRLGIFGWPVKHSKSPRMHAAAARAVGIELSYELFGVPPEDLSEAVREQHRAGIDGYNLTVPHKQAIMAELDEVTPSARMIGAVNTVVRTGERYVGHNTDAPGLVRSLEEAGVRLHGANVLILGAGGASRAAAVGLAEAQASKVVVLARRVEQAEALASSLRNGLPCPIEAAPMTEATSYFEQASLVVQATSATLASNPGAQAFAEALPISSLPRGAAVVDMVYDPLETTVLARARAHGAQIVDGLGMLLHQGAIAFEMWTGVRAPVEVMRAALQS